MGNLLNWTHSKNSSMDLMNLCLSGELPQGVFVLFMFCVSSFYIVYFRLSLRLSILHCLPISGLVLVSVLYLGELCSLYVFT